MNDDEYQADRVLRNTHTNVMIVGSSDLATDAFDRLRRWFAPPFHVCALPGQLTLPDEGVGTLLIRDVAALDPEQQQHLLQWVDDHIGRVQVVSVTSSKLYSQVELGSFNAHLYYRLNILLEEVDEWFTSGTVQ